MYMVWLVLDQAELLDNIQQAWEKAGIYGATIIESSGFFRRKQRRKYVATRYVLPSLSTSVPKHSYTIFSIVENEEQAQAALRATEEVVGDLDQPHKGIFAAWPLPMVKGLHRPSNDEGEVE
jgi:nitrogen regulatory protein PII